MQTKTAYKPNYQAKYEHKPNHVGLHQQLEAKSFDYTNPEHPVRKEINKNIGNFDLNVSVEEDKANLSLLKTPGLISFLCLLKINNKVIGSGRGSSRITPNNRFITNTIRFAFGSSILDAVAKTVKTADFLSPNKQEKKSVPFSVEDLDRKETRMISEPQKKYLLELVHQNISDEEKICQWESNIEDFTMDEARKAIQEFKS